MMDNNSKKTLRKVTENDPSLTDLGLLDGGAWGGEFRSDNSDDYSPLGSAIAGNNLKRLLVKLSNDPPLKRSR